jgi:glycosyltransferase involved in cell wall biosynthesis
VYRALRTRHTYTQTAALLAPDVLFCPFTVPYYRQAGSRCISIVHDLQHVKYPEFFTVEQRLDRQRHIADAIAASQRIACVSEYVRQTLITSTNVSPERAITIRLAVLQPAAPPDVGVLARLGLTQGHFVLYPANFWPHKNHARFFEAVEMYRRARANSRLRVVCTGAPNSLMRALARDTPPEVALFAGYVDAGELAALYDAAAALVFPSLYEGFGMPVLEALSRGTPVLCSNVSSLPEVAGEAAVYFDPMDPRQMADALEALADGPRMAELVRRGRDQAARAGDARGMAKRYLDLFFQVLS